MGRKLLELGKLILIIVLALAIVLLTLLAIPTRTLTSTPWLASLLRPIAPLLGLSQSELAYTGDVVEADLAGAAQPIAISIRSSMGRSSVQYDAAALDSAFEQLGGLLAQALDGASAPVSSTQRELQTALSGQSIAFCYPGQLPPALVAAWLNASAVELPAAQSFVLAVEGESVSLYLAGTSVSRCQTTLPAATLTDAVENYQPDGSFFAFEDAAYRRAAPLSLISKTDTLTDAVSTNPCEARFISSLAQSLGFNPYGDAKYVSPTGTTSFTETTHALAVTAAGQVELRIFERMERFTASADTDECRVEAARELLSTITASATGEARLYLTSLSTVGGETVCTFSYFLNGVPVTGDMEAEVRFSADAITSARILLRTIQTTAEQSALLPPAQAAAILPTGEALALCYVEQTEGTLRPAWQG